MRDKRLADFLAIERKTDQRLDAFVSQFPHDLGRLSTALPGQVVLSTLKRGIKDPQAVLRVMEEERRFGPSLDCAYVTITDYARAHEFSHTAANLARSTTPTPVAAMQPPRRSTPPR